MSSKDPEIDGSIKREGDDRYLDQALRPSSFSEYVGQEKIKDNLKEIKPEKADIFNYMILDQCQKECMK